MCVCVCVCVCVRVCVRACVCVSIVISFVQGKAAKIESVCDTPISGIATPQIDITSTITIPLQ